MPTFKDLNGFNQKEIADAIALFRDHPELAPFRFRATQTWNNRAHATTVIKDFHGAGREEAHREPIVIHADEPPMLLGEDHGANATEALLHALASCLGATFVYHATARGVPIRALRLEIEGELDIRAFLGITDEVRRGFQNIHVTFHVDSDAPRERIEECCRLAQRYSPVFDNVTHEVPVTVALAPEQPGQHAATAPEEPPQPTP